MNPTYKVIVLDDEPPARELIKAFISKIPDLSCIATCANVMQGLQEMQAHKPDLVFLDIQMPEINGLELLAMPLQHRPEIILTTAFPEYALQSYDFSVLDYLVKPIPFERFVRSVVKFREKKQIIPPSVEHLDSLLTVSEAQDELGVENRAPHKKDSVWLREEKRLLQIPYTEILYVEGLKDYVKVHLLSQLIVTHMTLGKAELTFLPPQFIRIHRSFIVRLGAIRLIDGNTLVLLNGHELPIGPFYREELKKYISFLG